MGRRTALGLDALGGFILALLLWELRVNVWTYTAVGIALAICICAFIWMLPIQIGHALAIRIGFCIVAITLLVGVLVPQGIDRFGGDGAAPVNAQKPQSSGVGAIRIGPGSTGANVQHNFFSGFDVPIEDNGTKSVICSNFATKGAPTKDELNAFLKLHPECKAPQ